jgi:ribosomal protein S18 acetylase RimI-like enzyme
VTGPVEIRAARLDEQEVAGDLCVRAYIEGGHLDPADPYAETLRDVAARASTTELLVAVRDGAIVGTVTICPPESPWAEFCRPGEFEFRFLAVEPESWGSGVAPSLVDACEERARDIGASTIVIGVIEHNAAGHRLYARLGFERCPERDWVPVPHVNLWAYRRPVPYEA